ncbi:glycerol-3-phosphate dehydrogenase (NAD+) [Nematocida displodere]|uniref:Glycerol-3-phosphate dehydrogenase [NAD(+)] n=1 Tax=Nematocida displodere TaxID=1805483 RepID=A0A177EBR2_9MICR|nr:glycerol-3-phosphate dehydrogenase (NAD+) [Nematocida displodere]
MEKKVCIVGGGSWGTAIAKLIGENVQKLKEYNNDVTLWIFEEKVGERNLSEIINTEHQNVKYMPDVLLPANVMAVTCLKEAVVDADVLVFVVPHEFLETTIEPIIGATKAGAVGVTLIKGAFFAEDKITLISDMLGTKLGLQMAVLMGANIAKDVAKGTLSECTLGCTNEVVGQELVPLFDSHYFRVNFTKECGPIELCGVLKNVVAMGCGIVTGHGYGPNTVAAVIRKGFLEMIRFCDMFSNKTSTEESVSRVFLESCGIADLIVTCTSGRNFRFSELAVKNNVSLEEIEKTEMNGQKLQGYSTSVELKTFLEKTQTTSDFTLLYGICMAPGNDNSPRTIVSAISPKLATDKANGEDL